VSRIERYSKCLCKNCGGHIEFPTEGAGATVTCPHCNWPTVLVADPPSKIVSVGGGLETRQRIIRLFIVAAIAAAAAGTGVFWYFAKIHRSAESSPVAVNQMKSNPPAPKVIVHVPPPDPWHGLMAGPVALEKVGEGNLVYAVGTISNATDHQRFGVKVDLDVFDDANQKLGTATDYTPSIDPAKLWKFKALVTDRTAARAKITSVKEN